MDNVTIHETWYYHYIYTKKVGLLLSLKVLKIFAWKNGLFSEKLRLQTKTLLSKYLLKNDLLKKKEKSLL